LNWELPMKTINECIEDSGCRQRFSRKEESVQFELASEIPFDCKVIRIDGCVFDDHSFRKCDYLFLASRKKAKHITKTAYYVELKGEDHKVVCEQLYNSIDYTKTQILNFDIRAKVVSTKGFQPNMMNSEYFRKVKRLIRKEIEFEKVHKGNNYTHTEHI
jgi:hypothetical protein